MRHRLFDQSIRLVVLVVFISSGCARLPRQPLRTLGDTASPSNRVATINVNTASAYELEMLPGIGPALAERIVTHRQEHGPFRRAEHLMMVRGISDRKFREIRRSVTVE